MPRDIGPFVDKIGCKKWGIQIMSIEDIFLVNGRFAVGFGSEKMSVMFACVQSITVEPVEKSYKILPD